MRSKLAITAIFILMFANRIFGSNTVAPTTTLAIEAGNNTSAASSFSSQSNGNLGAGNVSKVDTRTLLYSGSGTPIYAHFMGWFGQSSHMNVGYTSSSATQVKAQVTDALSRGISGFILDWYGPNNSMPNNTAFALMNEAQTRGGAFQFGIMYDGGALSTCHATSGCNLSQQAINDLTYAYNNFEKSSAYMTSNGRPVVWFFSPDRYGTLNWAQIASSVPGNPLFIFQNSSGFTHANSGGSFSWVMIDTSNAYDWNQSYLDNFYLTSFSYSHELTYGTGYKGFNDTLAAWGSNRIMNQQCGQVWMDTLAEIGKYFSPTTQLFAIQLVTWNDYEEGSEIETGIDNCVSVSPTISGNLLSWSVTGSLNTIDHFSVFISIDGQKLMSLGDFPGTATSFDLTSAAMAPGTYTVYVKATGKPTLSNKMSPGVAYTVAGTSSTALTSSPQPSMSGQPVTFTATVSPSAASGLITFYDGVISLGSTSLSGGQGSFSVSNLSIGSHSITAQYGGNTTLAGSTSPILNQTVSAAPAKLRVIAGRNTPYLDSLGQLWQADTGFNSGATFSTPSPISGTSDIALFQTERYDNGSGTPLQYSFSVPNGTYTVNLHFAEIWSGCFSVGCRVFNVSIQGNTALANLDVFARAGANAALVRSITTSVSNGILTIGFGRITQNPIISAIEILPATGTPGMLSGTVTNAASTAGISGATVFYSGGSTTTNSSGIYTLSNVPPGTYAVTASAPGFQSFSQTSVIITSGASTTANFSLTPATFTPVRIAAGRNVPYVDSNGNVWQADTGFNDGAAFSTTSAITGTLDAPLFQTERYDDGSGAPLEYTFSVPNGTYTVNLRFAEIWSGCFSIGCRVFNVLVQGNTVISNLDVFAQVGPNAALVKSSTASVTNGALIISFGRTAQNPTVSAIEILQQ